MTTATTKTCVKCSVEKTVFEFYARLNSCKECVKARVRLNYRVNRGHYVEYEKRREKTSRRQEFKRAALRRYRKRNPLKNRARQAVARALRSGRIEKEPCVHCGVSERVQAHHHDYSRPLDVEWLCKDCHWSQHGSVASEAA